MRTPRLASLLLPLALASSGMVIHAAGLPPEDLPEPVAAPFKPPVKPTPAPAPSPAPSASTRKQDSLQAMRDEVQRLTVQKDRLTAELDLAQALLDKELAEKKTRTERLLAELAELKAQQELKEYLAKLAQDKELAAMKREFERVTLESNIAKAESETQQARIRTVENSTRLEIARITADLDLEKQKAEAKHYVLKDPIYLKDPLQGTKLVLSDRRIPLNGPVTMDMAERIVTQINYFNNRDRELPMFIVIDDSPGGSVMAGYKILKAMKGSDAPVHVVVKSFAASMAACITTLADRSYAYPNAVILHHQISGLAGGNLTQQQEWVKEMNEWWRRLAEPVAQKMGVTREEFIKMMYEHNSGGDWSEFADEAQKLKWVDTVVDEIEETGTLVHPDSCPTARRDLLASATPGTTANASTTPTNAEARDEKGRLYLSLPRLNPLDCYWMYNPDGYYRIP